MEFLLPICPLLESKMFWFQAVMAGGESGRPGLHSLPSLRYESQKGQTPFDSMKGTASKYGRTAHRVEAKPQKTI